jgi:hypothetical protein
MSFHRRPRGGCRAIHSGSRTIFRPPDRRRQKAGPLGQAGRVHATGREEQRPRAISQPGPDDQGNPFILLEISSPATIKNLDHFKSLERKLYFQGGAPTAAERDQIFREGKAVVFVTNNIHSTEIGASQMVIELVHRLATENSPVVKKILDNVIFLLVPSLNPDGQIMVTDWYNKYLGTPHEGQQSAVSLTSFMSVTTIIATCFSSRRKESKLTAEILWHDWFPAVWLDEHQQGNAGARIFTMPATDPINQNVHPLIYRLNTCSGSRKQPRSISPEKTA